MKNTQLLYLILTGLTLLFSAGTRAALVNFEVYGTVDYVNPTNMYGLSANDTVSATGVFDDSVLTLGTGTVSFGDPGNSITLNIGSRVFTEADDAGTPSLSLMAGDMSDLNFLASEEYAPGQSVMYSFFTSFVGADNLTGTWEGASFSMTPVPVPAAVWLFGSGLLGLVGVARRRR